MLVDCVDHDEASARGTRGRDDRGQSVNQQLGPEPFAMQMLLKRKLGEKDRRNALRRATAHSSRNLVSLDEMRSERKVADNSARRLLDQQICASALACGVVGMLPQPGSEGIVPAIERVQVVLGGKRLDAVAHVRLIRLRRSAFVAARASLGASSGCSRDTRSWSK